MKKKRQENELAEAKKEAARQQAVEVSLLLRQEGPKFWSRLQKSLAITVDALPVLKLQGSISQFSEGIRIEVVHYHLIPIQTYTDVSYDPGHAVIRCVTMSGGICQLYICAVSDTEVAALAELDGDPMNPDQVSEFIMRPMVDYVYLQR